eukprot:329520-Chlamydomonas_euryale.AAC.7
MLAVPVPPPPRPPVSAGAAAEFSSAGNYALRAAPVGAIVRRGGPGGGGVRAFHRKPASSDVHVGLTSVQTLDTTTCRLTAQPRTSPRAATAFPQPNRSPPPPALPPGRGAAARVAAVMLRYVLLASELSEGDGNSNVTATGEPADLQMQR